MWKLWRRGYAMVAVGPLDGGGGYHCYATVTSSVPCWNLRPRAVAQLRRGQGGKRARVWKLK